MTGLTKIMKRMASIHLSGKKTGRAISGKKPALHDQPSGLAAKVPSSANRNSKGAGGKQKASGKKARPASVKTKPAIKSSAKSLKPVKPASKAKPEKKAGKTGPRRAAAVKTVVRKNTAAARVSKGKKQAEEKAKSAKKVPMPVKAKPKTSREKAVKKAPERVGQVIDPKKRRPRIYSSRSSVSSFVLGDEVIFRSVRDWNDATKLIEMKGIVVGIGSDPESNVNYIEIMFEVKSITGKPIKQIRRFMVR